MTTQPPRLAALAALLLLIASPASAATISQIQWDVTGGTFGGPNSTGPITGGILTFTPAGGSLVTPVVGVNHQGHSFALNLTGPSGSFVMSFPATPYSYGKEHIYNLSLSGFSGFAHPAAPSVLSGGTTLSVVFGNLYFLLSGGAGSGSAFQYIYNYISASSYSYASATHTFTLGNEVRTTVPEPGTGLLLYLGLGLGFAAGGGAAARRSRKARG